MGWMGGGSKSASTMSSSRDWAKTGYDLCMRSCGALYMADADTYLAETHQHRLRISATTWRMCMFWWLESRNSLVSTLSDCTSISPCPTRNAMED